MIDPTPTPQVPPQGLTDAQLDALERQHWEATGVVSEAMQAEELFNYRAFARAAIAAHEAARAQLPPNYIDPGHTGEDCKLLEAFYVASRAEGGTADEIVLRGLRAAIAAHDAARPQPTPEEVEARFRAWWGECYPNVPAGRHTVRSHVAFALHLMGGEAAA